MKEDEKITAALAKVKHKVLIFSGKGGVGKSTIAANLGLALARRDKKVGLLDVDLHGPNLAKMFGVEGQKMSTLNNEHIVPVEPILGVKLVSMAFILPAADSPVIWRGPLKMKAIQQFLGDVQWGELDWLIIDSPPGTGDEPLSIAQLISATAAIIVTTSQELSLLDSRKAVNFARKLNLRILGIIENMSGLICPHCGGRIDLFKTRGGEKMAKEMGVVFLGKVPIDPGIVESGDKGTPFVLSQPGSEAAKAFEKIVEKIKA